MIYIRYIDIYISVCWDRIYVVTGELTADLRRRAEGGTPLEELLPEAFALVREAQEKPFMFLL